ncbi:flippase-like domain-containing protein [candidate division WOR-3 bacterium]|nr:flippase-like domain-containing protein [candidate division WOR-3 bacterium]
MAGKLTKQIALGFRLFLTITFVTLLLIFFFSLKNATRESVIQILRDINPLFLLISLGLWAGAILLDALRTKLLVMGSGERIKLWTAIEVIVSGIFLATVTPFQTGGLPVQMYIFHKKNISPGKATLVLLFRGILQLAVSVLVIPVVIPYFPKNPLTVTMFFWVITAITVGVTVSLFIAFKPRYTKNFFYRIGRFMWNKTKKKPRFYFKFVCKVFKEINFFKEGLRTYLKTGKMMLFLAFLCTALFLMMVYLIPAFLMYGMGLNNFRIIETMALQLILTFVFLFAPTPGGSGLVELGFSSTFSHFIPKGSPVISLLTLAWRIITCYIPTVLGAVISLRVLHIEKQDLDSY